MEAQDKPKCRLTGEDGNAFSIIARVSKALRKAGLSTQESEFKSKAFASESYSALLVLCLEYVEDCGW